MIEDAFTIGILPQQLYEMELWEFISCVKAYNKKHEAQDKLDTARCWQTANFTGAAFGGKLKRLSVYLPEEKQIIKGAKLTDEQKKAIDEKFKAKGGGNSGV